MRVSKPVNHNDIYHTPCLTPEGVERLQQELIQLEQKRLPQLNAWLADMVSEGFGENDIDVIYRMTQELGDVECRIWKLRELIETATILVPPESNEIVQVGSKVTIKENTETEMYRIVDPVEVDPSCGYISYRSPLGKKLIGRRVGDRVTVQSPDGPAHYLIIAIE